MLNFPFIAIYRRQTLAYYMCGIIKMLALCLMLYSPIFMPELMIIDTSLYICQVNSMHAMIKVY